MASACAGSLALLDAGTGCRCCSAVRKNALYFSVCVCHNSGILHVLCDKTEVIVLKRKLKQHLMLLTLVLILSYGFCGHWTVQ